MVHHFDILLKEVFEIARCWWELGTQCGNALARDMGQQMGLQHLFRAGPAVCPLFVPGPEEQVTSVCMRGDLSSCRAQQLGCTPLQPPLTKIHLVRRQVPPALGLAVVADVVFLL